MSVSIPVRPSSSAITPALLTPDSPPGCSHTHTPSASSWRVRVGSATMEARYPSPMSERSRNLPRRSCLSIPGSSEKMLAKGPGLGADRVFLDLEDAVAPMEKPAARGKIVNAINTLDWGETVLCVRVNAWDTEWTYRDVIEIVEGASERLDELMLPKVESAAQVQALDMLLTQIEKTTGRQSRVGIEAQIETARGLINVDEICAASDRLETIILGAGGK